MENTSLFNELFNVNKTSTYHISMQYGQKGFSYCIIDSIRKKYVAIKHVNLDMKNEINLLFDNLKELIKNDTFLNKNYKSVDFIYNSQKSILVPNEMFDKNSLKTLFKYNLVLDDQEEIHFNKLKNANTYNVFSIPSSITTLMVNKFPEIKFFHQATPFIESFLVSNSNSKSEAHEIKLNINHNFIDIAVIKNKELVLYNTYNFHENSDIIYFTLLALQQLKIAPKDANVNLCGNIKENSELHKLLIHYMPNIKIVKINNGVKFDFNFAQHLFATIFDLQQ